MQWVLLSFACLVMCLNIESAHCFLGSFGNAHSVLGADLDSNLDLKTGFVSGEDSRTNIYGEVSTVKYHLKPNEHKLKLLLDEASACFDIQCRGSQILLRSKFALHDVPACVNFGISSFTSSSHTTGRLLRFDMQRRPSLNDLRKGDFVNSDVACATPGQQMPTGARRIVSIDRLSDNDKSSKNTVFLINTREAHLTDAVSQGSFEFRTENILTVNELPRTPNFQTRWELAGGARSIPLLNLNWNFDEGTAKAATKINIYSSKSKPDKDKDPASSTSSSYAVTLDCVNCFSSLKADLFLYYSISASSRSGLSIQAKAEISVRFVANLDFEFSADAAFKFSPKPISLAKLKPLMDRAFAAMKLFKSFYPLRVDLGMDISMGVDFEFKAKMKATIGADAQCNYRFGFYLNMPRPRNIDGCSYKLHQPTFSASGTIEIRPYIVVVPYVKVSLGPFYGRATTTVRPTLNIYVTVGLATTPPSAPKSLGSSLSARNVEEDTEDDSDSDASGSAISATFDAGVDLLIPVHLTFSLGYEFDFWFASYSRDYEIAKYELANFKVPLITSKSSRAPSSLPPARPPPPPPSPGLCTCNVNCGCCNCLRAIRPPMFDIRTSVSQRSLQQLNSPKVQSAFVFIPVQSRFEGNPNVAMLLSFVPSTSIHPFSPPGFITLTYPPLFFTSGPSSSPVANPSNIDGLSYKTVQSATLTSTSFVIQVDRVVPSNKVFIVTLYGLALGPPTSGSSTGIIVQTAVDAASEGISSGSIFASKLMDVGLEIDYMNRVQNKSPVPVVLKFTTFAPLPSGGRITFTFPLGFFTSGPTTSRSNIVGLETIALQPATAVPVSTSLVISITGSSIASYTNVVITLAGMAMGAATYGQKSGCTLRSSADSVPSDAFDSGFILLQPIVGQVIAPKLFKSSNYDKFFFSGNNISTMRLQFTTRSKLHPFSAVRVQFPAGYFAAGPVAASCSLDAFTVVQQPVSFLSNSSITIQTKKSVASFTFVIITLHGISLGSATERVPIVTVSTSSDVVPLPVPGFMPILPRRCVTFPSVFPNFGSVASTAREGDYIHFGLNLRFHAQTSMNIGGKITISFPPFFFNRSTTEPTALVGMGTIIESANTGAVMMMNSNSIVIVSPIPIPSTASVFGSETSTSVQINVRELYMGTAASSQQAGFFYISTDADPVPSPQPISTNFKIIRRFQIDRCKLSVNNGENVANNTINTTLSFYTSHSSQNLIPALSVTSSVGSNNAPTTATPSPSVSSNPIANANVAAMSPSSVILEVVSGLPAGQHTVTLEGMTLGAPSAAAVSGITVSTSFDYADASTGFSPIPAIGGQVTGVNFAIAAADRIPYATGKAVTFVFITATSIPAGGNITLSYPVYRGYFHFLKNPYHPQTGIKQAPKIVYTSSNSITGIGLFTTDVGDSVKQGHIILTVSSNPIPAGPQIVVLGDVTLGAATPGSANGITVSTSSDYVSVGAASGALGGQVTNVTLTIAQSDRVPHATNKQVTIYFATESALPVNDVIYIIYPEGFFGQGITPTLLPMTYTLPDGTTSHSLLSDTISVDQPTGRLSLGFRVLVPLSARSSHAILLGGMSMGAPTAGSATGICVETTKDYCAVGVASGALGGSVSNVTMYFNTQPKPNATVPATSFHFITETAIPIGGKITIFYPAGLFVTGLIPDGIFPALYTSAATDTKYLVLIPTFGVILPGQVHITLTGLKLGPRPLKTTGYTVSTSMDRAPPTSWISQIGGEVTNVGLYIDPADRIPYATGKTVKFTFTTATDLGFGHNITLTYPIGFFAAGIQPRADGWLACGLLGVCAGVTELSSLVIHLENPSPFYLPFPAGQHTVTLEGMTLGAPCAATTSGITVSTSMDVVSAAGPSPAIGGQVTGVNFSIAAADRIPYATGKAVTFTFTTATSIPSTLYSALRHFITLAYPVGLFSSISNLPTIASNAVAAPAPAPSPAPKPVVEIHVSLPTGMFMSGPSAASPLHLQSSSRTSIVITDQSASPLYEDYYEIALFGMKLDGGGIIDYSKISAWTSSDPEPSSCIWGPQPIGGLDQPPFLPPIESGSVISPSLAWEDNLKGKLVGYDRENSRVAMRKMNFTLSFRAKTTVIGSISVRVPSGLFAAGPMHACITLPTSAIGECGKIVAVTRLPKSYVAASQYFDTISIPVPFGHTFPNFYVSLDFFDVVIGSSFHGEAGIQITTDSNPFDSKAISIQTIVPNCVFPPVLSISSEYRQSGRTPVPITISFIPQSDMPSGSTVTVSFPPFLFTDGPQSKDATGSSSSASIANISVRTRVSVSDSPSASFFVFEISGSLIPKFTFISIFLDGMTIGNPMNNTPNSVRITTSTDTVSCIGADTGVILDPPSESPTATEDGQAPCACKTLNSSISYNSAKFVGSIHTNSQNWTILNASQVDTCDFSLGNVAAFTTIFVFPLSGFYSMHAVLSGISTESKFSSWNFMARTVESSKGGGCCGSTAFCGTLRFTSPHWSYPRLFMRAGDTISIVWTTEALANLGHAAHIVFSIQATREPVVYVDAVMGKPGNRGTFDEPVQSLQEGLFTLAALASSIQLPNMTATLLVRPSIYNQNNPHIPHISTGFIIPEYLKNIPLVISSLVSQSATTNYNAFQEQNYCNYLINNCTSQSRFFETSYATAFDTEIAANRSISGRAFTLQNVFSLTLQGFTVQNFKNRGDGGAFHLTNSSLILKNCIFSNNLASAYGSGGAVFATQNSLVLVQSSIFLGHRARGSGGVIYANRGSVVAIEGSILQDALAESLGGCVYFESSVHPAQFTSIDTKFYQAAASKGAAIAILGRHYSNSTSNLLNSFITSSDFSGLSASVSGGSILLLNASAQISLCGFSNSFSLSGAACVDSIGSTVALSANSYNFTGRPQNYARDASNVTEDSSYYSNGGNFCPIPSCTPTVLKDGNCNPVCNVSSCNFDGGDCLCPVEHCPLSSRGNGVCDIGCATAGCLYDSGDCCDVEVCPFNLRRNKVCDAECNSRACDYDDGDCVAFPPPPPSSPAAAPAVAAPAFAIQRSAQFPNVNGSMHEGSIQCPSVLATAVDSQVLRSIQHLRRKSIRASILSNDAQNSRFRLSGIDSGQDPSAVKCVSSSFLVSNTYIEPDPRNFATQGQLCLGLTTCTSCDACSVCSSSGCDSSYSDEVCRAEFGWSSRCIVLQPSAANNFSKLDCYRKGNASAFVLPNEETGLYSAWVWVAILIGCLLCGAAVTYVLYVIRRYRQRKLSIADNVSVSSHELSNHVTIANGSPSPANTSSMTPSSSIPGRSTSQSRAPQHGHAMRETSLAASSVSPPFSARLAPAQSSISPSTRAPLNTARSVSSDAAVLHVHRVPADATALNESPGNPVSSVIMSSVIPDRTISPVVSGSSISPPVSTRPVAQPSISSPAQSAFNATKPVANLLSTFSPIIQPSAPPLKASSSTSPARSIRAIPPSVTQTFLQASFLNSRASSAAPHPTSSVPSNVALTAVSESTSSAQLFHSVAAAASKNKLRGHGAFHNVPVDWDEDVYDRTPPRRPDTAPVLPRPRTPRLKSVDGDSSDGMEEFAVCDEDGLQAFQPAKLSGIAVSAVEAELEELRIDFDAAAAMAAAALAAELQDLSNEADV